MTSKSAMRGDAARTTPFLPLTMPVSKLTFRMNITTQPTLRRGLCGGTPGTSVDETIHVSGQEAVKSPKGTTPKR